TPPTRAHPHSTHEHRIPTAGNSEAMPQENAMNKKDLRKKLYVSSLIQGRIIGRLALYWALYHAVLWNVMFVYRYLQYRGELLAGAPPQSFGELYQTFTLQHYSMLVCAIAIGPIVLWDALRVTHRIAGPLVRFQN